jgi:hypothetical protein
MTDRKMAHDGYSKAPILKEGYIRKGGSNAEVSQIQTRPAPPAPMQPASSSSLGIDVQPNQGGVAAPKK